MEKELTKEEAEKKLKTQLKMLELQAQVFDEKINKTRNRSSAIYMPTQTLIDT